jgi:hypothetical protein
MYVYILRTNLRNTQEFAVEELGKMPCILIWLVNLTHVRYVIF